MEMELPLKPKRTGMTFTFLELLDRTFRIYRENFVTFIGLTALVTIPLTIIQTILTLATFDARVSQISGFSTSTQVSSGATSAVCLSSLILLIVAVLQFVWTQGPIVYIASESHMGNKLTIGEGFSGARPRFRPLGVGFILFYLVIFVFAFVITLIATFAQCVPALALFGVVGYIAIAGYSLLAPVLTLEDVRAGLGVNRAWSLGKARFWTGFGIIVILFIIGAILRVAFLAVVSLVVNPLLTTTSLSTAQVVNTAFTALIDIFILPLTPIALTLFYYDTRTRIEGLDIALQSLENPDARPADVESVRGGGNLTQRDVVNIIVLTLGALVIFVGFSAVAASLIQSILPGFNLPL